MLMHKTAERGSPLVRVRRVAVSLLLPLALVAGLVSPATASRAAEIIVLPDASSAEGMAADLGHGLLFVAGGFTGQGYVYDLGTGATVASYQFADPETSVINDVAVTKRGAWFTDSLQAQLYVVPVSRAGIPKPSGRWRSAAQRPTPAASATSTASRRHAAARP
jgi:hypothetical protein